MRFAWENNVCAQLSVLHWSPCGTSSEIQTKLSGFVRKRQPCLRINLSVLRRYSLWILWFCYIGCFSFPRIFYSCFSCLTPGTEYISGLPNYPFKTVEWLCKISLTKSCFHCATFMGFGFRGNYRKPQLTQSVLALKETRFGMEHSSVNFCNGSIIKPFLREISIKLLLVISTLYKTEWSGGLRMGSDKMNFQISTTFRHY